MTDMEFEYYWDHVQGSTYETFACADEPVPLEVEYDEIDDAWIPACDGMRKALDHTTVRGMYDAVVAHKAECAKCRGEEMRQPECTRAQAARVLFDTPGCELHDSKSDWNDVRKAVTTVQSYEQRFPGVA